MDPTIILLHLHFFYIQDRWVGKPQLTFELQQTRSRKKFLNIFYGDQNCLRVDKVQQDLHCCSCETLNVDKWFSLFCKLRGNNIKILVSHFFICYQFKSSIQGKNNLKFKINIHVC